MKKRLALLPLLFAAGFALAPAADLRRPHIILVMADDMGWGQTGYRGHPVLKTPELDAMAANGLRFERFYAGGPVCSPTRATVMTGRSHDRTGAKSHGYRLRPQEKTIAQALKGAGYATAHFGKWHLNGHAGPGAPILADDPCSPGRFGFDEWLSVSNFFDQNPIMSRNGRFEEFQGDSSEIIVDEAVKHLERQRASGQPTFTVIWYGTPHAPFKALDADRAPFTSLDEKSSHHYGELVAMDRSVGTLRRALRRLGLADNTLLVFCSDNGGLPEVKPSSVGGLRGNKGTLFEGGLRVPGIIEWPAAIKPRITSYPACTMDLFPTVADIVGLPDSVFVRPLDGTSLKPLFAAELPRRAQPIPFRYTSRAAYIDNQYKIIAEDHGRGAVQLYDLAADPQESRNLATDQPGLAARLQAALVAWNGAVEASVAGKDYPEGRVTPADAERVFWYDLPQYARYLPAWKERWEFKTYLERQQAGGQAAKKRKKDR
jgi:arylsulfatase A-like enzyme